MLLEVDTPDGCRGKDGLVLEGGCGVVIIALIPQTAGHTLEALSLSLPDGHMRHDTVARESQLLHRVPDLHCEHLAHILCVPCRVRDVTKLLLQDT